VSAIVTELLDAQLVLEASSMRGGGSGRPPIMLAFREDAFGILGMELGASHLSLVLMDPRGRVLHRAERLHDVQGDPLGTMTIAHELVGAALATHRDRRIMGLGLAVPCPLDMALSERILPAWRGHRPAAELEERWGLNVFMENDANLGALAEHWWGAAKGVECATYIKVATGVGAGHIVDGRLFRGANGIAGEIGHTAVAGSAGHRCRCGLTGCLEAEVGSFALVSRVHERLGQHPDSTLAHRDSLDLSDLISAANGGDTLATEVIAEAGRYLGVAVANLVNLMNPACVVIGGQLANADRLLLEPLMATMTSRALAASVEHTDVRLAELGADHIAIGAATLVLEAALATPEAFTQPTPSERPSRLPALAR
jgi:predicted NBD/HSP70 family sugar kinase